MTPRYTFAPERSRFTVQAFATGFLAAFGHSPTFAVRDFRGAIQIDPADPRDASFEWTVQSDSLHLVDSLKESDHQEIERTLLEDVLEAKRFAQISYQGTQIALTRIVDGWFRATLRGTMSLHGAKKPQDVDAQLRLMGEEIRLSGEFLLSQSSFGIRQTSAVGGIIKVKDQVKFVFDFLGHKTA